MSNRPLADRLRPEALDAVVGQEHLTGSGKAIERMLATGRLPSLILWGPPGVGKTTLARILARGTGRQFFELSAVAAGKDDLRRIVDPLRASRKTLFEEPSPVLFLDEIHRFNKAQQDFLLPYVEDGTILLIGATTENPSFEVIGALLSRCRVLTLRPLDLNAETEIVRRGARSLGADVDEAGLALVADLAGGDGRRALNLLEGAVELFGPTPTVEEIREAAQTRALRHDKDGESHYDLASAFIKSMRGSDPDAALYYLARLVEGGEDPKFIARRMVIFASEDVGLADPAMLALANDVFRACETIGYPECAISLAHGVAA
ncbi:replication-associated recombination protein A, partial [bacterium]